MSVEELEKKFKAMNGLLTESKEKLQGKDKEIAGLRAAISRLYLEIAHMALVKTPPQENLEPRTPTSPLNIKQDIPPLPPTKKQKYKH